MATAQQMGPAYPVQTPKATETDLMPVRDTLKNQFGIDDKRIGYNPQSGYVTIDNQNVLKPPVNQAGSTYAGQDVFNSAAGQINSLNNAYNLQQRVLNPQTQANPYDQRVDQLLQGLSNPQQRVNPIDAQFNQVMQQLQQRTQNPTVIDRNTAYASPQYAAQQAQAQRGAQQATRQAQEALGAARLGRSSVLADRAQGIQNDANQFLETQALPQIIAELQAQEDAQTRNLYNLLGALGQQQSIYDNRGNQETQNQYNLLGALGQQQGLQDTRNNQQFDRAAQVLNAIYGRQDRAQDVDYRNQQFEYGKQVDDRNFNYQAGVDDRNFNADQEYRKWQQDFQQGRANESDNQFWSTFERNAQEFAAQQGLQWAQLNQREKERISDEAYRQTQLQMQGNNQQMQQADRVFSQGLEAFKTTGQMPDFMKEFGIDVQGMNTPKYAADLSAMYDMLSTGKAQPKDLLKQIDDKVKIGAEQSEDGERMKQAIYTLYPNLNPSKEKEPAGNSVFNTNWLKNLAGYGILGFSKLLDQTNLNRLNEDNPSLNGQ